MSREKEAMVVMVKDGLVIEGQAKAGFVILHTYAGTSGVPVGTMILPAAAFDELLDLVIHFGL